MSQAQQEYTAHDAAQAVDNLIDKLYRLRGGDGGCSVAGAIDLSKLAVALSQIARNHPECITPQYLQTWGYWQCVSWVRENEGFALWLLAGAGVLLAGLGHYWIGGAR